MRLYCLFLTGEELYDASAGVYADVRHLLLTEWDIWVAAPRRPEQRPVLWSVQPISPVRVEHRDEWDRRTLGGSKQLRLVERQAFCLPLDRPAVVAWNVARNGMCLGMVPSPDLCLCLSAVREDGFALQLCPSAHRDAPEVQEAAVRQYPLAIEYVPQPSTALCLLAVRGDPMALLVIDSPAPRVFHAAVTAGCAWVLELYVAGDLSARERKRRKGLVAEYRRVYG